MEIRDLGALAMRILMFGWEFPRAISGGLGTACFGMTKALAERGHRITFVVPSLPDADRTSHVSLVAASDFAAAKEDGPPAGVSFRPVESPLKPYMAQSDYGRLRESLLASPGPYGTDLFAELERYAAAAGLIARQVPFDVIHAHEWLSVPAALRARQVSGCPFVFHVHALESDRSGGDGDARIVGIERQGLLEADRVIAVSRFTRRQIVERYGIDPGRSALSTTPLRAARRPRDTACRSGPAKRSPCSWEGSRIRKGPGSSSRRPPRSCGSCPMSRL